MHGEMITFEARMLNCHCFDFFFFGSFTGHKESFEGLWEQHCIFQWFVRSMEWRRVSFATSFQGIKCMYDQ